MVLKILLPVVAMALIGWGAWATVSVTDALPEEKFEAHEKMFNEHKEKVNDKFDSVQRQVVDKLDDIQKTILDLHRGE